MEPISMTMTTSIDAMFKRKRGRPPKNRVIEVRHSIKRDNIIKIFQNNKESLQLGQISLSYKYEVKLGWNPFTSFLWRLPIKH